jgi:CRISPR system Cascade subunit CasE
MYLSRLILNPRNRRVQREIANPHELHRSVTAAFSGRSGAGERVLFRLETHPHATAFVLLVQSLNQPDWSWLHEPDAQGYLLPTPLLPAGIHTNLQSKPFELELSRGQTLAFRLRANPTVKRTVDGQKKRQGLYQEEEQRAWLARKAEQGGFDLLGVRTSREEMLEGHLQRNGNRHALRFLAVQFDGVLQVRDPARLHTTVKRGIGSAKGFGFGLLSLAPARMA